MTLKHTALFRRFARLSALLVGAMLISVFLLAMPSFTSAQQVECIDLKTNAPVSASGGQCPAGSCQKGKLCNPVKSATINAFLMDAVGVVVQYGLILIVFFLVLAGFKFVVAQGNPEKISEARKMLVWVIVGAFVLLGVYVIRASVCGTIDKISADPAKKACQ